MRPRDLETIRALPCFEELDDEQLTAVTSGSLLQRFPRETVLFEQGERPDFLHVLVEGSVLLYGGTAEGRETVIEILTPVDNFILAAALTDTPYLMSAKALEPSTILMLPARNLREQVAAQPKLALSMMASLASQFRRMVRQVKDLKLRTSTQRLAAYLMRLAVPAQDGVTVELPVNKQVLASRLGMTPENLSRAFATLAEQDIQIKGRTVTVGNIERLRAYCNPDTLIDDVERDLKVVLD
ncbi:MAG TPA: cyclic nucleotide-binding domain-containing protein [Azospirillum sp.]|nr:cyclic nucleotide-binding domain-containing protein [Azospirillum sp.]